MISKEKKFELWLHNYPELKTRKFLLEFLYSNIKIRKKVFGFCNEILHLSGYLIGYSESDFILRSVYDAKSIEIEYFFTKYCTEIDLCLDRIDLSNSPNYEKSDQYFYLKFSIEKFMENIYLNCLNRTIIKNRMDDHTPGIKIPKNKYFVIRKWSNARKRK